ncbi:MarR family winged helix-turn-helix transcriptional regulator [Kitasatospora sp. NBC_00315]|uniref:MarR family winged helix-turn-helix transcriptional regulator n=1 Tax=Kitasatospora sp. NBC_00315 TaxID=2975963 RepID=UPI003243478F
MSTDDTPMDDETLLEGIGPDFSRLRRHAPTSRKDASRLLVLNVVADATGEMTVGTLAEELITDPSVASRMVSDCISGGYLRRAVSQQDGRRTVLEVTTEGHTLRAHFAAQQRQIFELITAQWAATDRIRFARLLHRYVEDSATYRQATNP